MTVARQFIIDPSISRYYHCVARCVRRSFLCGEDKLTGRNFDHRKAWLVERMKLLASIFAVNVCAYAALSNHYHIVLYWDIEQSQRWSERDVVERWCQLYQNKLGLAYLTGATLSLAETEALNASIVVWRKRLKDISWYMRCLNEHIARMANQEDKCTGHFWEGRFRSQALLDETALLSCMAYVDLNPIRAGICERLEDADFTSIQERIRAYNKSLSDGQSPTPEKLMGFADKQQEQKSAAGDEVEMASIPCSFSDYLELVDWTGRRVRNDNSGSIPSHVPPMLVQLGLADQEWVQQLQQFRAGKRLKVGGKPRLVT